MSETILQNGDVIVRGHRSLRRLTLNRPQAFNALTLDMAVTMTAFLRDWAADPEIGAILIDGAGDRGLCAGGDLRALYDAAKTDTSFPAHYWATEYKLDVLIARYAKPIIVIMDGLVMGGGMGIAAHAAHRVVTDRSAIAMPEVGIGLFPDVGVSYLLARAPGFTGTHLALTGSRIGAADAIDCGLADIHVPAVRLADFAVSFADCRSADDVDGKLDELSTLPAISRLATARSWIDSCYATDCVEDIIGRLRRCDAEGARKAVETMCKASPTSLKVTLQNLRAAASFKSVEQSFQQDYRIALACIAGHDFIEGIRATIVDKDRNPAWCPDQIEAVTPDIVERHFRPVGALELNFDS